MNAIEVPTRSGAYRWFYVDVSNDEYTAVFIFMIGSVFSARYSKALESQGHPAEHVAVNFALYRHGSRKLWALNEYPTLEVSDDRRMLRVGGSTLRYEADRLHATVVDRTVPFLLTGWGQSLDVQLTLTCEGPSHDEVRLVDGLSHFWRPIAARAHGVVTIASHDLRFEGRAYHDGNHGASPLGADLRGWEWVRQHHPQRTTVVYRPWHEGPAIIADVDSNQATVRYEQIAPLPTERTAWALRVPRTLGHGQRSPKLMESSPFYARLECSSAEAHSLGEVADFGRFHLPTVRWLAQFKTHVRRSA